MAKIRSDQQPPYPDAFWTAAIHFGDPGRTYPPNWHMVYAYGDLDLPPGVSAYHVHLTYTAAYLEAITWAAMPLLIADICTVCRYSLPGPNLPRWFIYRGPDHTPWPPSLLWDFWSGPPPWPPI